MRRPLLPRWAETAGILLGISAMACGEPAEAPGRASEPSGGRGGPPGARWEVVDVLREAADTPYHASDGGGRAWLVPNADAPQAVVTSTRSRFRLVFEVGEQGIASGGAVHLQVSPFWGWSTPQVADARAPGFTKIRSSSELDWDARAIDQQLLRIENRGRAWRAGERLEIDYGAGEAGAITDRYAERESRFWFAVDGDGDGRARFLPDSPGVDVIAGPPTQLRITIPSLVRPGERFRISLAWLDSADNAGANFVGDVEWVDPPAGLELPSPLAFAPAHAGLRVVEAVATSPGLYRLEVRSGDFHAKSNPLQVDAQSPRILWGDLHGHSSLSDGTGLPDDYYRYARDVSALDVAALTDHDHWGILPLSEHPELWERIRDSALRFHDPGRFVTLLGFEWTNWIHGHRHVLYFGDEGAVIDSIAEESDSPEELWAALAALEGAPALTVAHHPAGGPVPTNWEIPPDPLFEPVTEIVSIHGSSEAADSPGLIQDARPGHFVRDALDRGYRLGFLGSGDRHDGHPGSVGRDPLEGGLAAILSEERSREGVLAAIRARRVYATNGPRILLRAALGAVPMGGVYPTADEGTSATLFVRAVGVGPLDRLELIRSGSVVDRLALEGQLEVTLAREVHDLQPGEYLYLRVLQSNGGAAWSSPIFVD